MLTYTPSRSQAKSVLKQRRKRDNIHTEKRKKINRRILNENKNKKTIKNFKGRIRTARYIHTYVHMYEYLYMYMHKSKKLRIPKNNEQQRITSVQGTGKKRRKHKNTL